MVLVTIVIDPFIMLKAFLNVFIVELSSKTLNYYKRSSHPLVTEILKEYVNKLRCQVFRQLANFRPVSQQKFTCSKSTIEILEKGVKYVQS